MASVNRVILVGNLGKDPETRYMASGDAVTNISIATSDTWKDKETGEKKESTEWHRVVFYRRLAEITGQYLKKGSQVYIEGRIRTRKWQDKDGNDRYTTEIDGTEMKILHSPRDEDGGDAPERASPKDSARDYAAAKGGSAPRQPAARSSSIEDMDDDIPF